MAEANYCLSCGEALETRLIGDVARRACPKCSFVFWGDYSVGVGALVVRDGKVLLVRRAQDPGKGRWTNPGGYMEQLESIEKTIVREVMEETGVTARIKSIVALRDQPRKVHNLYVAFAMEYVEGEPRADQVEVDAAGFYSVEEMKEMNVADFTKWLVDTALNVRDDGLLPDTDPVLTPGGNVLFRMKTG
jgi:ADP-ribose pyrophosphatase YjhB (NUDIX family)